jgi:hypothetical protein
VEGVSNILLLGFKPTITKKEKEITNNAYFSLPIPRKREIKPSYHPIKMFTKKITIQ